MWLSTKLMKKEKKKKRFFYFFILVSVVNKSQYHDTHSEDTIGNVRDTDYLSLIGAVNSKQHTINIICM